MFGGDLYMEGLIFGFYGQFPLACSRLRDGGGKSFSNKKGKSRSVIRKAKNARGLGRDRAAEPVRIFLTACSGISAPDIPSDWSIVTVNITT